MFEILKVLPILFTNQARFGLRHLLHHINAISVGVITALGLILVHVTVEQIFSSSTTNSDSSMQVLVNQGWHRESVEFKIEDLPKFSELCQKFVSEEDLYRPDELEYSPYLATTESIVNSILDIPDNVMFRMFANTGCGGEWKPSECVAREKVAIIIPYRKRFHHLKSLQFYLHRLLRYQQQHYKIYVIEQVPFITPFSKGRLNNAAFEFALKDFAPDCVIFHDVDYLPANPQNLYGCRLHHPVHLVNSQAEPNSRSGTIKNLTRFGALAMTPAEFK